MYVERRVAFDIDRDRELIEFLDGMTSHKANQLIRELLRGHIKNAKQSQLDRIESKLYQLQEQIRTTPRVSLADIERASVDSSGEEPEDIAVNLDGLGV